MICRSMSAGRDKSWKSDGGCPVALHFGNVDVVSVLDRVAYASLAI